MDTNKVRLVWFFCNFAYKKKKDFQVIKAHNVQNNEKHFPLVCTACQDDSIDI